MIVVSLSAIKKDNTTSPTKTNKNKTLLSKGNTKVSIGKIKLMEIIINNRKSIVKIHIVKFSLFIKFILNFI